MCIRDRLKVLSKYVEIEKSKLNIEICPYDEDPRKIALVANIPILKASSRRKMCIRDRYCLYCFIKIEENRLNSTYYISIYLLQYLLFIFLVIYL